MTGTSLTAIHTTLSAMSVRASSVRVENARNSSDLRDRAKKEDAHGTAHPVRRSAPKLSQGETGEHAPLWYGPRLRPAFVAQVLGQVMPSHETRTPGSVFAAYEESASAPVATHLERRI